MRKFKRCTLSRLNVFETDHTKCLIVMLVTNTSRAKKKMSFYIIIFPLYHLHNKPKMSNPAKRSGYH